MVGSPNDRERGNTRIRSELRRLLEQAPDPATLERIRCEKNQLNELAAKPVSTLSGEEARRLITGRNWSYADAPGLFQLWWRSVDKDTQKQINVAAEDFEDVRDYFWKSMKGPVLNATRATLGLKTLYAQFQQQLPKISESQFVRLWLAAERRSTIKRRGRQRSEVKTFSDDHLAATRQVLYNTFSLVPNRPAVEQARDRQFSKQDYRGWTRGKIAREWNRQPGNKKHAVTSVGVRKAIERYREKRAPIMWLLRLWIYSSEFPSMPSPRGNVAQND